MLHISGWAAGRGSWEPVQDYIPFHPGVVARMVPPWDRYTHTIQGFIRFTPDRAWALCPCGHQR